MHHVIIDRNLATGTYLFKTVIHRESSIKKAYNYVTRPGKMSHRSHALILAMILDVKTLI